MTAALSGVKPGDKPRKAPLRWKRKPAETGLRRIGAGPRGSDLHDGTEKYASTNFISKRHGHKIEGWYWTARNDAHGIPLANTCYEPVADEVTAKANAMAYVRKHLAKRAVEQDGEAA